MEVISSLSEDFNSTRVPRTKKLREKSNRKTKLRSFMQEEQEKSWNRRKRILR